MSLQFTVVRFTTRINYNVLEFFLKDSQNFNHFRSSSFTGIVCGTSAHQLHNTTADFTLQL